MDGIRWLFAPVISWWGFLAVAPSLVYVAFGMIGFVLLLQLLRLFMRK